MTKTFLPCLNAKFHVEPRSAVDAHRRCELNLKEVLSWEETRVVARDWTVGSKGRWLQITAEHERLSLVGKKITVRELRTVLCNSFGKEGSYGGENCPSGRSDLNQNRAA